MMTKLHAHFDGRVLIPEGPVDLPVGEPLEIQVVRRAEAPKTTPNPVPPSLPKQAPKPPPKKPEKETALMRLARILAELPDNPDSPTDLAAQHDHYLYGTPKRP